MSDTENSTKQRGRPFQKGKSGNPGGRPGQLGEFREMCRTHTAAAVTALVEALSVGGTESVSAARVLLEYGWGKPAAAPEDNAALRESGRLPLTREECLAIAKGETP